jgi:hypothetical protein
VLLAVVAADAGGVVVVVAVVVLALAAVTVAAAAVDGPGELVVWVGDSDGETDGGPAGITGYPLGDVEQGTARPAPR